MDMKEKLKVEPKTCSWSEFNQHSELMSHLWDSLKLKEKNEGDWEYMSFTSDSSTWELNVDDSIAACLSVALAEEDDERIIEITLALKDASFYDNHEINTLLSILKKEYQLIATEQ